MKAGVIGVILDIAQPRAPVLEIGDAHRKRSIHLQVETASGGELSRALLALKRVLAGLGGRGTWVFDEVDTGVGGAVGEVIGQKLGGIARHHQVICVTHLPQIAAQADHHFRVSKQESQGRTVSGITALDKRERVEEVARMLGGIRVGGAARKAAVELMRSTGVRGES